MWTGCGEKNNKGEKSDIDLYRGKTSKGNSNEVNNKAEEHLSSTDSVVDSELIGKDYVQSSGPKPSAVTRGDQ